MLNKGYVTPFLQRKLLSIIPQESNLGLGTQTSIWGWRSKGNILPISSTASTLLLKVNPYEFGEATYCDIQHLMNHAAEHRACLVNSDTSKNDPSPSWTFVTIYYWALFLSLTISRLQNNAIIFLDKDSIQTISNGATGKPPGGGVFRISLDDFETTSRRSANLKKSRNSHFHEVVWTDLYLLATSFVETLETLSKDRKLSKEEMLDLRAFRCFTKVRFSEPHAWQSTLRNAINYRHGFSYRSVVNDNNLNLTALVKTNAKDNFTNLIESCEAIVLELKDIRDPLESPGVAASLVMYQALILEVYCQMTIKSFCINRGIEETLTEKRSEFLSAYFITDKPNLLSPLVID